MLVAILVLVAVDVAFQILPWLGIKNSGLRREATKNIALELKDAGLAEEISAGIRRALDTREVRL